MSIPVRLSTGEVVGLMLTCPWDECTPEEKVALEIIARVCMQRADGDTETEIDVEPIIAYYGADPAKFLEDEH